MDHYPVLANEVIQGLACAPGHIVVDATVGSGGHAQQLLSAIAPNGVLIGIDRDPEQIARTAVRLQPFQGRAMLVCDSYERLPEILEEHSIAAVDGILFDLGVAQQHLEDPRRGMGFRSIGTLDLRFNPADKIPTAAELLRTRSDQQLETIFRHYGEIPRARGLARAIVRSRRVGTIETTADLERIATPFVGSRTHHPLTLVLQALRIAVNDELGILERALPTMIRCLTLNGRIAVITYHSLEDRIVKTLFRQESRDCICPPSFPVCRCGHRAQIQMIGRKPIRATREEQQNHPTARSAQLRVAQRISL